MQKKNATTHDSLFLSNMPLTALSVDQNQIDALLIVEDAMDVARAKGLSIEHLDQIITTFDYLRAKGQKADKLVIDTVEYLRSFSTFFHKLYKN